MKKIPAGAEACNVLVGEADFLNRPMVAFVRLSPAVLLSGLAEVPITTRYGQVVNIVGIMVVKTWKFVGQDHFMTCLVVARTIRTPDTSE